MPYQHLVHYTLTEARAALPEITAILRRMKDLKHRLDLKGYDIRGHRYFGGMGTNGTKAHPDEMEELILLYHKLTTKGIQLKDIDKGLIDFPSIRPNGEEVYLCYMLGEPGINYWHTIEDGYPGRKHVDTL
jgi:hypothetical protein